MKPGKPTVIRSYTADRTEMPAYFLRFELPFVFPTQNELLRMHYRKTTIKRNALCGYVKWAILNQGLTMPAKPQDFVQVIVERHSVSMPDPDNLTCKGLLDVLQPLSLPSFPSGLGIISGDSSRHIILQLIPVLTGKRGMQHTVVIIESMERIAAS